MPLVLENRDYWDYDWIHHGRPKMGLMMPISDNLVNSLVKTLHMNTTTGGMRGNRLPDLLLATKTHLHPHYSFHFHPGKSQQGKKINRPSQYTSLFLSQSTLLHSIHVKYSFIIMNGPYNDKQAKIKKTETKSYHPTQAGSSCVVDNMQKRFIITICPVPYSSFHSTPRIKLPY